MNKIFLFCIISWSMTSCLQWDARAGEICDTYHQMGVPGAILSGYNAVDLMLNKTPH